MIRDAILMLMSGALAAGAAKTAHLEDTAALGISAAFGIVGGVVSALIMAGDASVSVRRVAVCVLTTGMIAPLLVFTALDLIYDGSRHLIPVVCTSGAAGLAAWPITDKTMRAFGGVSPAAFGQWLLETLRKIIGRG